MKYLIDTDWLIDHLNGVEKVESRLEELAPEGLVISIVSLAEIYEGIFYSREPQRSEGALEAFLPGVPVLNINEEIRKIFGKERGRLRQQGRIIGDLDLFIASTCLYYNLILLTNNVSHFERIEALNIIAI
jgi:tRNA(fMet)-specific endonuclease VapC